MTIYIWLLKFLNCVVNALPNNLLFKKFYQEELNNLKLKNKTIQFQMSRIYHLLLINNFSQISPKDQVNLLPLYNRHVPLHFFKIFPLIRY